MMKKPTSFWLYVFYRFGPIIFVFLFPLFVRGAYFWGLGQTVCYYAIAIAGLNILVAYTDQVSLAQSAFMAIGAYTSALLSTKLGLPLWATLPLSALVSSLVGFVVALPVIRTRGLYLSIITVAFCLVVEILSQRWIEVTSGTMGIYGIPQPALFGKEFGPLGYFYLVAITWAILQWIADNLVESRWGKVLLALNKSEDAAKSIGINTNRQRLIVFVMSAAYAGISGFFLAHQTGYMNSDNFSIHMSFFFLVASVIGGSGSHWGPLVGASLLTAISQVLAALFEYRFFIYGGILLVTLTLMPEGLMGALERRLRLLLKRSDEAEIQAEEVKPLGIESVLATQDWKSSNKEILEIRNLTRSFGGLVAVNDVDLKIRKGHIHAIIGPNGAGKTTLINLVAGGLKAQAGGISFMDLPVNGLTTPRRAALGITRTFQTPRLFGDLSVLDNILLGFYCRFRTSLMGYALSFPSAFREEADLKKRAMDILRFLGIGHLVYQNVNDLPYGHQKLVELARALAVLPHILLLDEPVGGLNRSETGEIFKILARLREVGVTILLVEHNMDFVMRISDRVSVFNFGKKIAEGSPEQVQKDPEVIEAYLGRRDLVHTLQKIRQGERSSFP